MFTEASASARLSLASALMATLYRVFLVLLQFMLMPTVV